jgi:hypothetical protein
MTLIIDDEDEGLSALDHDALTRAVEIMRASKNPNVREQIEAKLADEPWRDVAEFAAYSCQCDALRLRPWQSPPAWIDPVASINGGNDGVLGDYAAAKLLRRMLDLGVSKFEPDPLGALKAKGLR